MKVVYVNHFRSVSSAKMAVAQLEAQGWIIHFAWAGGWVLDRPQMLIEPDSLPRNGSNPC